MKDKSFQLSHHHLSSHSGKRKTIEGIAGMRFPRSLSPASEAQTETEPELSLIAARASDLAEIGAVRVAVRVVEAAMP